MKQKNSDPRKFSELGCFGVILLLALTCFAAFNVGVSNPYSSTVRFEKVFWDEEREILFFTRPMGYRMYGIDREGHTTCESDKNLPPFAGWGGRYADGTVVSIVSEPLDILGVSQPLPNSRLIATREGDDPFTLSVDRWMADNAAMQCNKAVIQVVPMFVLMIAGIVIGCAALLRFPYRYRVFKLMVLVVYVGVIFYSFYMGYAFSVMRATFTGFD